MSSLLDTLCSSPRLPKYLEELKSVMSREAEAREKFLEEVSPNEKAEFINGKVVVHSPVRIIHNRLSSRIHLFLTLHLHRHPVGYLGIEKLMVSLSRNDYEPDVVFWKTEKSRHFTDDQLRLPAPDLVVEVLSESTEANDRGVKFEDYAAHKVDEYWIVDPDAKVVEQYLLNGEQYELHMKSATGILASRAVEGFAIDVRAIFDDTVFQQTLEGLLK
jgi:Uma2 family endonuclease